MRLAPIPPLSLAHLCKGFEYQFCIATEALRNEAYGRYYKALAEDGQHYVILDSGVYEVGATPATEAVLEVAKWILPQEVIVPDRLYNAIKTIELADKFIPQFHDASLPRIKLSGVIQGVTMSDWSWCAKRLCSRGCDTLCIQKGYARVQGGRSLYLDLLIGILDEIGIPPDIHLLGWADREVKLEFTDYQWNQIRSMDTVKPFTHGMAGKGFGPNSLTTNPGRPEDYFDIDKPVPEEAYEKQLTQIRKNLEAWKHTNDVM